jgi:hypothetical protein
MHNVLDVYYRPLPAGFSVVVNYDNFRLAGPAVWSAAVRRFRGGRRACAGE